MIFFAHGRPSAAMTLRDLLENELVRHTHLQPGSRKQKITSINTFEEFLGRTATIDDLDRDVVEDFLIWYEQFAEPSTVDSKRKDLKRFWNFAFDEGIVTRPPRKIRAIRIPTKEPEGWDETELRQMLKHVYALKGRATGFPDGRMPNGVPRPAFFNALIRTLLDTGLRLNAQLAVKKAEVRHDLTFTVRWYSQKTWHEQTKRLSAETWAAVQELHRYGEFEYLLPWPHELKRLWQWWRRLLDAAGLDSSRGHGPQQLRRTAASFKERQQPGSARAFLGHKTHGLAEKHYLVPRIVRPDLVEPPRLNL